MVHILGGAFSLVVGVCYFALLLAQSYGNQPAAIGSFMVSLFLVLAGAVLLFDLISTVLLWIAFRRNRLLYSEPHSILLDDNGIRIRIPNAEAYYQWSFYKTGVEGSREFILIYGNDLFIVVPKAAFQSETEMELFRGLLKRNLVQFKQRLKIPLDFQK